jgi:GNAT superfamily N-acetyltransferase
MSFTVAPMERQDARRIADLWRRYMLETYAEHGHMTAETFLRDGLGEAFHTMVAKDVEGSPVAAAVWWMTYDAHHGARGGEIPDRFAAPSCRRLGVAVQVIAAIAREVRDRGGVFLRGPATPENAHRLAARSHLDGAFPVIHVYWANGVFDVLADNADASARTLARRLTASAHRAEHG